jgi:hypothetical protein
MTRPGKWTGNQSTPIQVANAMEKKKKARPQLQLEPPALPAKVTSEAGVNVTPAPIFFFAHRPWN